jgi:hypothetical protein
MATQNLPEFNAISRRVVFPIELLACRSSRAEAKKAVAVRAARETRASTLMRAKLGEDFQDGFFVRVGMEIISF